MRKPFHMRCWLFAGACTVLSLQLLPSQAVAQAYLVQQRAQALKAAPTDPAVWAEYGQTLLRAGQIDEAKAQYERAAMMQKYAPQAVYLVARVASAEGSLHKAKVACRAMEKDYGPSLWVDLCTAAAHVDFRRASLAIPLLEGVLAKEPGLLEARLLLADAQRVEGNGQAATDGYAALLAEGNLSAAQQSKVLLGQAALERLHGDELSAVKLIQKAAAVDGDDPEVQYALGSALKGEEALSHLERALAGRAAYPEAKVARARLLVTLGRYNDADLALRAIAKDPASKLIVIDLDTLQGVTWLALNRLGDAEVSLNRAVEKLPDDGVAALNLARLYAKTGRVEEALDHYRTAAGLLPQDPTPLLEAGKLATTQGRGGRAVAFFERAAQLHPTDPTVQTELGDALSSIGDFSGAKIAYLKAEATIGPSKRSLVSAKLSALEQKVATRTRH